MSLKLTSNLSDILAKARLAMVSVASLGSVALIAILTEHVAWQCNAADVLMLQHDIRPTIRSHPISSNRRDKVPYIYSMEAQSHL